MSRVKTGCAVALLLWSLIPVPLAAATKHEAAGGERYECLSVDAGTGMLPHLWRILSSLWEKEGSSVDPDGNRGSSQGPPNPSTVDEGSSVDPNGTK